MNSNFLTKKPTRRLNQRQDWHHRNAILRSIRHCSGVLMGGGLLLLEPLAIQAQQNIDLASFEDGATTEGFVIHGGDGNERAGFSVSGAGDLNGDGLADLIIGAILGNGPSNARQNAGTSYVIFGKTSEFNNIDLVTTNFGTITDGFAIEGAFDWDGSGISVSGAGDVNGDGIADVIVGASRADGPDDKRGDAGDSYVIYGKPSGFNNIDLATFDYGATSDGFAIHGALGNVYSYGSDYSGTSVSGAGDINGDGFADLLVGIPYADGPNDTKYRAGDTCVIFGKPSGFNNIDLASFDSGATSDGFALLGGLDFAQTGISVSGAGDVNGDGFDDLIIGAQYGDGPTSGTFQNRTGEAYVIFGKSSGFNNIDLTTFDFGSTGDGYIIYGASTRDDAGYSVSGAGDVNGDGFADLIVGAPQADGLSDGRSFAGNSYVIFGKASNINNINLASLNSGPTSDGFVMYGTFADRSGISVSGAGDVNGDGFGDLIIGAWSGDGPSDERNFAGDSYLIFGKGSGFENIDLSLIESGGTDNGFAIHGAQDLDRSGNSVSGAGDINGDGFADFIVGAYRADGPSDTRSQAGDSYVIFGKASNSNIPSSATYRAWARAGGVAHPAGVGVTGDGSDFDSPSSRVKIGFFGELDSGGPGLNGASLQEVTLFRHKDLIQNVGVNPNAIANVSWRITTNRERYTNVWMKLIWTAAEVSGLNRDALVVYEAPTPTGPWILAPTQTNEPNRRRVVIDTLPFDNGTKYFIIVDSSFDARAMANEVIDCLLGQAPPAPHHDVNRDGLVNISDVVTLLE